MTDPAARFELCAFWRTSATDRVRVAFHFKGVQPQEHNIDLDAGEQRSEAFLRVNPMGAIPALIDLAAGQPKTPLTQSLAILELIEKTCPTPPLLPADAHVRAGVRSLAAMHHGRVREARCVREGPSVQTSRRACCPIHWHPHSTHP